MLICVFGSGVPTVAIASYVTKEGSWKRVRELHPKQLGGRLATYSTYVVDDTLIVVGEESGNKLVIYSSDEEPR